jgi:hypothetical protein
MGDFLFRAAEPGDCFVLFSPSKTELAKMAQLQHQFHNAFGGQPLIDLHLTCQRFLVHQADDLPHILRELKQALINSTPFSVVVGTWVINSLRVTKSSTLQWQLQSNSPWYAFRDELEQYLKSVGISPDYGPDVLGHITVLRKIAPQTLATSLDAIFPRNVFQAQTIQISQMTSARQFEILDEFQIGQT